ncbi:MAG: radical SAM protein [Bryobacteraceae bacterium]
MSLHSHIVRLLRPVVIDRPHLKQQLVQLDGTAARWQHSVADRLPIVIRPQPRLLTVAITARCNLRCIGCRYERDFMLGQQLPLSIVLDLLHDAREAGFERVRLYGGEPLLHKDLARMVQTASELGLHPFITTNGLLLGGKIEELYSAGLRSLTIGYYGNGNGYDRYVQRHGSFARLERSIAAVRDRYGTEIAMQINFLLCKPSANLKDLESAWRFALRYSLKFQVDLVHYSLPYFSEGIDRELQFTSDDRPALDAVKAALAEMKEARPDLYPESIQSIYSIADWAIKGPNMRVPCTAYRLIWVGADGTVQLCYVTFKLGNLHKQRLREMLFTDAHYRACRDAFALNCPNCHCERDDRIRADSTSHRLFTQLAYENRRVLAGAAAPSLANAGPTEPASQ